MRKYSYRINTYRQNHFIKKLRRAAIVLVALVLLAIAGVVIDQFINKRSQKPVETPVATSVRNSNIEVFRSKYFQFQAPKEWVLLSEKTTENIFYYQAFRDNFVEKELIVHINEIPARTKVARTVPVVVNTDGTLTTQPITEHCDTVLAEGANRDPKYVTIEGVEVFCDIDSALFTAVAGEVGGDTAIDMQRPDGEKIEVLIEYKDFTSRPQFDAFEKILETFQVR